MSDQQYLESILAKIAEFERAKEMQAARYHAHAQNERRKYSDIPERVTAHATLETT